MNIGAASKASGVSSKMIRHYESIGLIAASPRGESGYRHFSAADIEQLRFIRHSRDVGFSLEEIRQLLLLWQNPQRASAEVKAITQTHIDTLSQKIAQLDAMRRNLQQLSDACQGTDDPNCPILAGLETCSHKSP